MLKRVAIALCLAPALTCCSTHQHTNPAPAAPSTKSEAVVDPAQLMQLMSMFTADQASGKDTYCASLAMNGMDLAADQLSQVTHATAVEFLKEECGGDG